MNIYAKPGSTVKYLGCDKDQVAFGGNDDPTSKLVVGQIYTIAYTLVHSWYTEVYLTEFPELGFNSVCFEDAQIIPFSTNYTARLDNWLIVGQGTRDTRISGQIYEDSKCRWKPGSHVSTARVKSPRDEIKQDAIISTGNSTYLLGEPYTKMYSEE